MQIKSTPAIKYAGAISELARSAGAGAMGHKLGIGKLGLMGLLGASLYSPEVRKGVGATALGALDAAKWTGNTILAPALRGAGDLVETD